jgi:hypothetical protein
MKKVILVLALLCLNGCSLMALWPKPHDPVMFGNAVDVKVAMSKISCDDKKIWNPVLDKIETLRYYSDSRNDPQAKNIAGLEDAMKRAKDSNNNVFCESLLKLNKTRVDVVLDAWKGR